MTMVVVCTKWVSRHRHLDQIIVMDEGRVVKARTPTR